MKFLAKVNILLIGLMFSGCNSDLEHFKEEGYNYVIYTPYSTPIYTQSYTKIEDCAVLTKSYSFSIGEKTGIIVCGSFILEKIE